MKLVATYESASIRRFENGRVDVIRSATKEALDWVKIMCQPNNDTVFGSWTEFNIRTRDNVTVKPDKVGYLPTINAPATELSTVQELLSQSVFIQQHLSLDKIAVIMDQALYAKAAEVAWKHKLRFESFLLMMGNFHIICNMLSIIGKLFRDAGLRDLAVESGVIGEGSIDKVLDGKQYNRGVRLHKITYEALMRLVWKGFLEWLENNHSTDLPHLDETFRVVMAMHGDTCATTLESSRNEESCQSQEGLNHADLQSSRVKRDENDVKSIVDMLENNWTNSFSNQPSDLVSLSIGAAATSAITSDLLKPRSKGEEAFKIHKERLESGSGFFDLIKKQNLQTFTVLQKNTVVNAGTNREMILKADNRVFGNMLLIAQSRKLDMKDVLQYPLGPKPWALANADGTLKKTGKATLGNHLEKEVANVDVPSGSCATNSDALKQQTNRANYQAAIWRRSLQNSPEIPSPTNGHGWNVVEGKLGICWLTGAPAPDVVLELMSCKCPRRCNENCPCVVNGFSCTPACKLLDCDNMQEEDEIEDKIALFKKAMDKQTTQMKKVISGHGIDNHLLALSQLATLEGIPIPDLFTDSTYKTFLNFRLSTSQVTATVLPVLGYGPVVPDGYGAAYNIQPEHIIFNISAFNDDIDTRADFFASSLESSLLQMRELLTRPNLDNVENGVS
ncbi:Choline O-acetyltransferase [Nymphon striatum]|nr:Choline O-acetyltransferase [Nymphon striatum]